MRHLNSFSTSGGGNLIKNFPKIQMPRELPGGGGCWSFDFTNTFVVNWSWIVDRHTNFKVSRSFRPAPKITTFGRSDCPIIGLVLVFYFEPYRDELRIYTTTFVSRELSRVLNRPSFKTRLSAKPFSWKWHWFAWKFSRVDSFCRLIRELGRVSKFYLIDKLTPPYERPCWDWSFD